RRSQDCSPDKRATRIKVRNGEAPSSADSAALVASAWSLPRRSWRTICSDHWGRLLPRRRGRAARPSGGWCSAGPRWSGCDGVFGLQGVQGLEQVAAEDRVVLAHGEVADLIHLDEGGVADAVGGAGAVVRGGQVVVLAGEHDDGAAVAVDVLQVLPQVVVDGVDVQVAL